MKTKYVLAFLVMVIAFVLALLVLERSALRTLAPLSSSSGGYTCKLCGSIRHVDTKYILGYIPVQFKERISYKSPGFSSCKHEWKNGISYSPLAPVKDGIVVLARESGKYGAFILRNQTSDPERAEYDWWYQSDGSGSFDVNSPTVTSGHGVTPRIRFGSFVISWSAYSQGSGWLYYKHSAGDQVTSDDLYLCITDLDSLEGINAASPKWKYKATPVD